MYIDVFLLTVIFVLCVINTKISYFTKPVNIVYNLRAIYYKDYFQILKWLYQASTQEKELLVEKVKLKNEQAQISMVDNFARHAKIQRKINAIDEEMSQMKSDRQTNHLLTRLFFQFIMKFPIVIILFLVVIFYRNYPVVILNEQYNLFPFSSLISYPLQDVNGVSVQMWVICCSSILKLVNI